MDLEARVAALEAAVAALRSPTTSAAPVEDEEPFWLVQQIRNGTRMARWCSAAR